MSAHPFYGSESGALWQGPFCLQGITSTASLTMENSLAQNEFAFFFGAQLLWDKEFLFATNQSHNCCWLVSPILSIFHLTCSWDALWEVLEEQQFFFRKITV
jgi:hypothetical protein